MMAYTIQVYLLEKLCQPQGLVQALFSAAVSFLICCILTYCKWEIVDWQTQLQEKKKIYFQQRTL